MQNEVIKADGNDEMSSDAIDACKDACNKFNLFMAHRMRCKNQQLALENLDKYIRTRSLYSKGECTIAHMVIDFKMKFEPMSTRETTLDHYGKRGIGWHGIHIVYYTLHEVTDNNGTTKLETIKQSFYIDQILDDGNKQDSACVLSLIDSALTMIQYNIPQIKEVIVQSDNANSYQNMFLVVGLALLNGSRKKDDIRISTYTHTETQDGKTVLDTHFATCMRFLYIFMKTWKANRVTRINTPNGLGFALAWKGGIHNAMVQVVQINREHLNKIYKLLEPTLTTLKSYFTRVNQVEYIRESKIDMDNNIETSIMDQISKFTFDHSNLFVPK